MRVHFIIKTTAKFIVLILTDFCLYDFLKVKTPAYWVTQ